MSKTKDDTRLRIGSWALIIFLALLLVSFFLNQIVYYGPADFNDWWKIAGRVFFVFTFHTFGIAIRAFRFYDIGKTKELVKPDPWMTYLLEYGLVLGIVISVFVFSVASVITSTFPAVIFYLMSGPLGVAAGYRGYGSLESVDKLK